MITIALQNKHLFEFNKRWRPQGDSNPCRRRERPVSWTRLDDGDAKQIYLVGRIGLEPMTLSLKGRYSTD